MGRIRDVEPPRTLEERRQREQRDAYLAAQEAESKPKSTAWLESFGRQLSGEYSATDAREKRQRAAAESVDPVSGRKASPWASEMSRRMTPQDPPMPGYPPAADPIGDAIRARHLAEIEEQRERDERAQDGWLGSVEDRITGHDQEVRQRVEALDAESPSEARERVARSARIDARVAANAERRRLAREAAAEDEVDDDGEDAWPR